MKHNVYCYIFVMWAVTYLIRVLPLTLIRREIKNRTVRSFLHYGISKNPQPFLCWNHNDENSHKAPLLRSAVFLPLTLFLLFSHPLYTGEYRHTVLRLRSVAS